MNMQQIQAYLKAKKGLPVLGRQPMGDVKTVKSRMKGSLSIRVFRKNGDVEDLGKVADLH